MHLTAVVIGTVRLHVIAVVKVNLRGDTDN